MSAQYLLLETAKGTSIKVSLAQGKFNCSQIHATNTADEVLSSHDCRGKPIRVKDVRTCATTVNSVACLYKSFLKSNIIEKQPNHSPEISVFVRGIDGELICGPVVARSDDMLVVLRQRVAKSCEKHQYITTLLKDAKPLNVFTTVEQNGVVEGDTLVATFSLGQCTAATVLRQCTGAISRQAVPGLGLWLTGLLDKLQITADNEAWIQALPWLEAWFITNFKESQFPCLHAAKGYLVVDEDTSDREFFRFLVIDFDGCLATFADSIAAEKPGAIWMVELFKGEFEEASAHEEFVLSRSLSVHDFQGFPSTRFVFHFEHVEEWMTQWALTQEKLPSSYQVQKALEKDQYVF